MLSFMTITGKCQAYQTSNYEVIQLIDVRVHDDDNVGVGASDGVLVDPHDVGEEVRSQEEE